ILGDVPLVKPSGHGLVYASTWASRSRVLAVVVSPGCCGLGDTIVSAVDADSRRVLWRRDLAGSLQAGASYRGGLVLVLGPKWAIGPSRLVRVEPNGRLRTVRLEQIRSGWQRSGGGARSVSHQWNPGLALDPTTSSVIFSGGVLFGFGTSWDSRSSNMSGSGLNAYDPDGRQLYHRYGRQPIGGVEPVPRGVLVGGSQGSTVFRREDLLEPRSGRLLAHAYVTVELLSGDQPFWY